GAAEGETAVEPAGDDDRAARAGDAARRGRSAGAGVAAGLAPEVAAGRGDMDDQDVAGARAAQVGDGVAGWAVADRSLDRADEEEVTVAGDYRMDAGGVARRRPDHDAGPVESAARRV